MRKPKTSEFKAIGNPALQRGFRFVLLIPISRILYPAVVLKSRNSYLSKLRLDDSYLSSPLITLGVKRHFQP